MFENTIHKDKKLFFMKVGGSFTPQEAEAFINDYNAKAKQINAKEYCLIGDAGELKASTQEMIPILSGIIKMYLETGFKKIIFANLKSASTKLQTKQLCKQIAPDRLEVVDTVEQAMKLI